MKDTITKIAVGIMAAALTTGCFAGCAATTEDIVTPDVTVSDITTPATTEELVQTEPAQTEPAQTEPDQTEPAQTEQTTAATEKPVVEDTEPATDPENQEANDEYLAAQEEAEKIAEEYEKEIIESVKPVTPPAGDPSKDTSFSGDPSTALTTTLPAGCYWSPTPVCPNAYKDAEGNLWVNSKRPADPAMDSNCNAGYYDPAGRYHPTQEEIEHAAARNAEIESHHTNGPTGFKDAEISDDDAEALHNLRH